MIGVSEMQSNIKSQVESEIRNLKLQMIQSGITKGLNHPDTIKLSQKLDKLLNDLQNLTNHKK